MPGCSLFRPRPQGLLSRSELASLILFQRLSYGWVREVHLHSSKRKKGKIFVLFRNTENRVLSGLAELTRHLEEQGLDDSWLESCEFLSDRDPKIVSNRVGANKKARREAGHWMEEAEKAKVGHKDDIRKKVVVKDQSVSKFTEYSAFGLGNRHKEEQSRKTSLADVVGQKVTFQDEKKVKERGSRSLGSFPATPGPREEQSVFPQPTNINIVINNCEVRLPPSSPGSLTPS